MSVSVDSYPLTLLFWWQPTTLERQSSLQGSLSLQLFSRSRAPMWAVVGRITMPPFFQSPLLSLRNRWCTPVEVISWHGCSLARPLCSSHTCVDIQYPTEYSCDNLASLGILWFDSRYLELHLKITSFLKTVLRLHSLSSAEDPYCGLGPRL
jgi:hypothetical protein